MVTLLELMTLMEYVFINETCERIEQRHALPPERRPERRSGLRDLIEKGAPVAAQGCASPPSDERR